ncbi:MAG: PQQ-binding-like beta-propeller repeat protein [candidate division WOR-3 bacterium]
MLYKYKQKYQILFISVLLLTVTLSLNCPKKKNRPPDQPITPIHAPSTYNNKPELFKTITTDPENDDVRYIWDWGDNTIDTLPYDEYLAISDTMYAYHAWENPGTYSVKVRAIDKDSVSVWSNPTSIQIIYNAPPIIDSFAGPGISPYITLKDKKLRFAAVASDSTDSVYVRFIYRKSSAKRFTERAWIGPKVSGSIFRDSLVFSVNDTYIIRAIAKDSKGSQSDTTNPYIVIVSGPLWRFMTVTPAYGGEDPDTTDYEFYSSPALGQDANGNWRIFIGAIDGCVYSINPTNGNKVWREKSVTTSDDHWEECCFNATPAVNQSLGHIYIGSDEGELYCISTSGTRKWRFPGKILDSLTYDEFGSSVAFSGNRLYVGCDDYKLYCLQDNISSVSLLWSYYTGSEIGSSPAIDAAGNVYFADDSGYVTSLTSTGTVRWRIKYGISIWSSPTLTSDRLYIGTDDGYLYALNPNTGAQIWRYTADDGIRSSPVIGTDNNIYFGCNDGKLYALTTAGTIKSGFPVQLSDEEINSSPAIALDGTIVVYTNEDMVYGISPSGSIVWQVPLPGYGKKKIKKTNKLFEPFSPSPTIGPDGTIYVASAQAGVFAIKGTTNNSLANTAWPKFRHDIRNTGRVGGSK